MSSHDLKRMARLTAILTQLQSKRLLTASELAENFSVSVRTIYRDIRTLEQAGVPIFTEEGKGYSIMDGYHLPPVMFSESEANALITAEQLIKQNKDASLVASYTEAILKIKSVLRYTTKDKANLLAERIVFRQNLSNETTSNLLSLLQIALTNYTLCRIRYASESGEETVRCIEPFALYSTQENWILIAFCRLRNEFRSFRLDRISQLITEKEQFDPHPMSLREYFEVCRQKSSLDP